MTAGLGERVARNAAAAFGGQAMIAIMGLAVTAVIVRAIGTARFGAWSLIAAIIAYAGLMDLGLGVALVRRVADAESGNDRRGAGEAVGAALVVTIALALVTMVAIALLAPAAAGWLRIPAGSREEFIVALRICGVGAALSLPGSALGAVPAAFQQLARVVKLEVRVTAVVIGAQVIAMLLGGGLVALAWAFLAGRAISLLGRWRIARRMLDGVPLRAARGYPYWSSLGQFGALKVAHQLMSQVVLYLDRLLVGIFVSVEAVAYYTVAMELAQRLLMVQSNVAQAFYPAASTLARDRAALGRLYVRTARAVALFTLPAAAVLAALAGPLLAWWVGPEFRAAAPVLAIVALAYACMALTAVPAAAADALGEPGLSVRYGLVSVTINIVMALVLIPRFGAVGAAWAIAINVLVPTPFFLAAVARRLSGVTMAVFTRRAILEPMVPAAALAALLIVLWLVLEPAGAWRLPLTLVIAFAAFVAALRLLLKLDDDERGLIASLPGGQVLGRLAGRA